MTQKHERALRHLARAKDEIDKAVKAMGSRYYDPAASDALHHLSVLDYNIKYDRDQLNRVLEVK